MWWRRPKKIESYGADGITVHPRPDARHITYDDVRDLQTVVHTEFNIEGYPNERFVEPRRRSVQSR